MPIGRDVKANVVGGCQMRLANAPFPFAFAQGRGRGADPSGAGGVRPYMIYSKRSAEMGSTLVAFLAGTDTARSATASKKSGVRTKAIGSHFFTPNRNPVKNLVSQKAPAIPMTKPIPAS